MYCSKCGSLMSGKLNYCKNCGARLAKDEAARETPKTILDSILASVTWIVIIGLGLFVGLIVILLSRAVTEKPLIMITFLYLAALTGICFMLLSQLPKLIDARLKEQDSPETEHAEPARLSAPTTAQLEEHREPVQSVTENTTRTFEKIPLRK